MLKKQTAKIGRQVLPTLLPYNWKLLTFQLFFFAVLGWIYETILVLLNNSGWENRGFLFGPYLPIYGFGMVLVFLCLLPLMKKRNKKSGRPPNPLAIVLLMTAIITVGELVVGLVMETVFHHRWWDYTHHLFNLWGHISLLASFRFAIGGAVFLYVIAPWQVRVWQKLKPKVQTWLAIGIIVLLSVEFGVAVVKNLGRRLIIPPDICVKSIEYSSNLTGVTTSRTRLDFYSGNLYRQADMYQPLKLITTIGGDAGVKFVEAGGVEEFRKAEERQEQERAQQEQLEFEREQQRLRGEPSESGKITMGKKMVMCSGGGGYVLTMCDGSERYWSPGDCGNNWWEIVELEAILNEITNGAW